MIESFISEHGAQLIESFISERGAQLIETFYVKSRSLQFHLSVTEFSISSETLPNSG